MNKFYSSLIVLSFAFTTKIVAQSNFSLGDATIVSYSDLTKLPNFIKFYPGHQLHPDQFSDWAKYAFHLDGAISFRAYSTEKDPLGFTLIRFKEYINEFPVDGTMLLAHMKDGNIISVNGDLYQQLDPTLAAAIPEGSALQMVLKKINAKKYKWENKIEEDQMKIATNDPAFSYFPKGELVLVHKDGADYSASSIRLAYKFNVYAEEPLTRKFYYLDAQTGEVISEQTILHDVDVVGTANTVYSGVKTMTSDNFSPNNYRLQETGRGNGIKTFNMNNSTTYTATDFTNGTAAWNLVGPDQAATDAHWGAEATYDYYSQIHSRNSIDGNGFALLSYVHYSTNYVNAFWDGTRMTYGDGNISSGFTVMTGLDVCGHEITHGLTTFTANLGGGEAGALNEAWSDIMGTTIEAHARPTQWDWIIGADITTGGTGIRTMSNPNLSAYPGPQPDTYMGTNWDPNGEVHNNDGPAIFWYYLLCQGGSGTNDNNNTYNVTGITMAEARMIAFRGLTVYMTTNSNYANARVCTIQAANDLYGACSPEVIATTNAWYAVGVGPQFSATVVSAFNANVTSSCSVPTTINFTNTSTNANLATWYFGDNTTSTQLNPSHTYTSAGTYTVKLVSSGACGSDSVTQVNYITINPPTAPTTTGAGSCTPAVLNLAASGTPTLNWFTNPTGGVSINTGNNFTTPLLNTTTTYYVETDVAGPNGTAGPLDNTFGTGGNHNSTTTRYEIFDVLQPCTLVSVLVYSSVAGVRTINLWDNAGNVIQTWSPNIPNGTSTITLNAPLTPGTGFRLGGTSMNLYRNNASAVYPYSYAGYVNITGNNNNANSYYFFYKWIIQAAPCTSARTPVIGQIGCTGINSALAQTGLSIYPNPSNGNISLVVELARDENAHLNVMNSLGQIILEQEHDLMSGNNKFNLDLSNLSKGIYFIQIKTSTDVVTKKVVLN